MMLITWIEGAGEQGERSQSQGAPLVRDSHDVDS
jgi:hypothetical protein